MSRNRSYDTAGQAQERKCIATGALCPTHDMLRFVVSPDGHLVADVLGKLPGRGIWVSSNQQALQKAVKKRLFAHSAKQPVQVSETLLQDLEAQLSRRVVDLLSLARKSGRAIAGYEKVKDWLSKEQAKVLVQSSGGSERGTSTLSTPSGGRFIGWLRSDELGMAFGRQTVIHCALASSGITQRVVEEAQRLKGLRITEGTKSPLQKEKTAR